MNFTHVLALFEVARAGVFAQELRVCMKAIQRSRGRLGNWKTGSDWHCWIDCRAGSGITDADAGAMLLRYSEHIRTNSLADNEGAYLLLVRWPVTRSFWYPRRNRRQTPRVRNLSLKVEVDFPMRSVQS
jgi:hypothetical protein